MVKFDISKYSCCSFHTVSKSITSSHLQYTDSINSSHAVIFPVHWYKQSLKCSLQHIHKCPKFDYICEHMFRSHNKCYILKLSFCTMPTDLKPPYSHNSVSFTVPTVAHISGVFCIKQKYFICFLFLKGNGQNNHYSLPHTCLHFHRTKTKTNFAWKSLKKVRKWS